MALQHPTCTCCLSDDSASQRKTHQTDIRFVSVVCIICFPAAFQLSLILIWSFFSLFVSIKHCQSCRKIKCYSACTYFLNVMMLSCYLLTEPNQIICYFRGEDDKTDLFTSLVVFLYDETVPGRAHQY